MAHSAENSVLKSIIGDFVLNNIAICKLQSFQTQCLNVNRVKSCCYLEMVRAIELIKVICAYVMNVTYERVMRYLL